MLFRSQLVRDRLKTAQSRQKSYADHRRRDVTFAEGDFVYLRVTPLKGMQRFHVRGKLAPRYIGPFRILKRKGEATYKLELPAELKDFHDVFHVSLLRKCLQVPESANAYTPIDHKTIDLNSDLSYHERLSISWAKMFVRLVAARSSFSRFNGQTIPPRKLLGNVKRDRKSVV